ncbi:MAG TPA: tetratricopeptide repeat protein [Gemmatimonadales bacterium]|nr:tetratricopeptide repeat protein [Gemmatimonadales bacterium]
MTARAWLLLGVLASPLAAQRTPYDRAFDLERRGSYAQALTGYRQILESHAADLNALLGLERVLHELGRSQELAPPAAAAIALEPENPVLLAVAIRGWTAARQVDSAAQLVNRWAGLEPASEAPYREWGFAALAQRDQRTARKAYQLGRQRLNRPDALAGELAQLATYEGDIPLAVSEWLLAIRSFAGYRSSAVGLLSQLPTDRRQALLAELDRRGQPLTDQLAASLQARWNEPLNGYERLTRRLPAGADGIPALQEFLEEVRTASGRDASLARARTLEVLADRQASQRTRYLAEAARAYSEAGDQTSARRMLARLSNDPKASPEAAATAGVTLVSVLISEGKLEEADQRLKELRETVTADEHERLIHRLARAWLRAGKLDRGQALVARDSSVEGFAIRGRALLYRGDIAGASRDLAAAGPFATERGEATERAAILAVLQVIDGDSLPALGAAYQALERGDSAGAAAGFATVAGTLPPDRGGAHLFLIAGRLRAGLGAVKEAEQFFRSAAGVSNSAAAPAAGLELARILVRQGRPRDAIATLEQLILEFPQSAVAPQARRLLDTVRGGAPPA